MSDSWKFPPDDWRSFYQWHERAYGQFRREIDVNVPIDRKAARAELENGLLVIHLPKVPSKSEPSHIPIL